MLYRHQHIRIHISKHHPSTTAQSLPSLQLLPKEPRSSNNLLIPIRKVPPHDDRVLRAADDAPTVELQLEHAAVRAALRAAGLCVAARAGVGVVVVMVVMVRLVVVVVVVCCGGGGVCLLGLLRLRVGLGLRLRC